MMLMLFAAPAAARAEISVIGRVPLAELLSARDKACRPLTIGGQDFLSTVVFDDNWNTWFMLKPVGGGSDAGLWTEEELTAGAAYSGQGLELRLKETGGVIAVETAAGESTEISLTSLFDRLYDYSPQINFGGVMTYAVVRNLGPLTGNEGTVTIRVDSDGLYYYSLTPDKLISAAPRWLLVANGMFYGLKVEDTSLLFVSKPVAEAGPAPSAERALPR